MDLITVGIDVSKDRLDVAVFPSGEAFVVERDAAGLESLAMRLRQIAPHIVALEATGGFETVATAALAAAEAELALPQVGACSGLGGLRAAAEARRAVTTIRRQMLS
jgi:transposase